MFKSFVRDWVTENEKHRFYQLIILRGNDGRFVASEKFL